MLDMDALFLGGGMANIEELRPVGHQRVMDLVEIAGVDVSDWANFKGGKDNAAANPKYCYEWSFVARDKIILNLWYASMQEHNGLIFQKLNQREVAIRYERLPKRSAWARRARNMDRAILTAFRNKLPVRVIICDGEMRDIENDESEPSKVEHRMLDPIPWAVTAYDWESGECTISRGVPVGGDFVDQFDIDLASEGPPEKRTVSGETFVRCAEVRRRVLSRANGRCEFCSQPGFAMSGGRVFLETHHIFPLAEGGLDNEGNVVALCPNHHREAHFGVKAQEMRELLIRISTSNFKT